MTFIPIQKDPRYEISENGDIRNAKTKRMISSRRIQRDGYYHVMLGPAGGQKSYMTHRLLAEAFVPNRDNKRFVIFKDRNHLNIATNNLEWANDRIKTGHKCNPIPVRCITDGKKYKNLKSCCRAYGVCELTIKHSYTTGASVSNGLRFELLKEV